MNLIRFIAQKSIAPQKDNKDSISILIIRFAILTIILSLLTMGLSVSILKGFQDKITQKIRDFSGDVLVSSFQEEDQYTSKGLTLNKISNLWDSTEIEKIYPFAYQPIVASYGTITQGAIAKGVKLDYLQDHFVHYLQEGRLFSSDSIALNEVIVSQELARLLSLKLGDSLNVFIVKEEKQYHKILQVVGLYTTGLPEIDAKIMFISLEILQKFHNWLKPEDTQVGGIEIFLKPSADIQIFTEKLAQKVVYRYWIRDFKAVYPHIFDWLSLMNQHVFLLLSLMSIICWVHILAILLVLIFENKQRINLLYELGLSVSDIRKIFVVQVLFILGKALLYGNIILWILIFLQDYFQLIPLDAKVYFMSAIPVKWEWTYFISINLSIVVSSYFLMLAAAKFVVSKP